MNCRKNKMERLFQVARLYYEEQRTQGEIADWLQVSRPLVSRMLREARDCGIVEIRIHPPACRQEVLLDKLCQTYHLKGATLIEEQENSSILEHEMAKQLIHYIGTEQPATLGIGWGGVIGALSSVLGRVSLRTSNVHTVCPLMGNSSISSRAFHTDENVRIIAGGLGAQPKFLHTPVFPEDANERTLLAGTSHFRSIRQHWEQLDMALIGIHEPSTAQTVAFPGATNPETAGYLVGYSYDVNGRIMTGDEDFIVHIPREQLSQCRQVVGLCAPDVSPTALAGALRTGLLTHLFVRSTLIEEMLSEEWNPI